MELQQVRYFVTLADTLNFTRAAEDCGISQPALSRAIRQLEDELGGSLFHRERGNTHLSELGKVMRPYLESIHAQSRAAKEFAQAMKSLEQATLTIGAMCTIAPQIVSDLIVKFRQSHPSVDVVVVDGGLSEMVQRLEQGDLEIAIIGVPDELPPNLHQLPIFEERFVIVLPQHHPLSGTGPLPAHELDKQPYVSRSQCEFYKSVQKQLHGRGIVLKKVFSSPRDDWVQCMIKAGLGIGFFPENSVSDPDLVVRPIIEPHFTRKLFLATVRGRPHSAAVGAFIQQARTFGWPNHIAQESTPQARED